MSEYVISRAQLAMRSTVLVTGAVYVPCWARATQSTCAGRPARDGEVLDVNPWQWRESAL